VKLSINIDHIATLRQARGGTVPDPVQSAVLCEKAGADGIVCHLREDRRHINDRDVFAIREKIGTKLDLEMAATEEIIGIALRVRPDLVTLVPEKRHELTTEGGLNVVSQQSHLSTVIERFHRANIPVSLFVDPETPQLDAAKAVHADIIEIHTGEYADAADADSQKKHLIIITDIAKYGKSLGLGVNAGHGLNYLNIDPIAHIAEIDEVSIGHSIICRALIVGLIEAVQEMKSSLSQEPVRRI
jgi:pyridoxine 5-phosphate synthase